MMVYQLSTHSSKRAAQRGISAEMIQAAVNYGKLYFRQGLRYFICLEKHLSGIIPASLIEQYRNTVVIINSKNQVVTCYKNKKAINYIKKKNKWLSVYNRNIPV